MMGTLSTFSTALHCNATSCFYFYSPSSSCLACFRDMRILLQRVLSARVEVNDEIVSQIGHGLLLLVGFSKSDVASDAESICQKVLNLPVFDDVTSQDSSKISVMQSNNELLIVSQFSLYGVFKGNRLDFHDAMPSEEARPMYEFFLERLGQLYRRDKVKDGLFGVKRQVFLVNNGPMAFQLESENAQ